MRLRNIGLAVLFALTSTLALGAGYVNNKQHDAVRVATTENITLSGLQTIDGVSVAAGDSVAVLFQTAAAENGIYRASAGAWTRRADYDSTTTEVVFGSWFFVGEGTSCTGLVFSLETDAAITLGTTPLLFVPSLASAIVEEASTAGVGSPNILRYNETTKTINNTGATALAYNTLPPALPGFSYNFTVTDADGLRLTAGTGDTIRQAQYVTAGAGYLQSTSIGSSLRLDAINDTEWIVRFSRGTWNSGTFTFGFGTTNTYASSPATYSIDAYTSTLTVTAVPGTDVTISLPLAATVGLGWKVRVVNTDGTCSVINNIIISRSGSDTFNGGTSFTLNAAYAQLEAISDGVSTWTALQ